MSERVTNEEKKLLTQEATPALPLAVEVRRVQMDAQLPTYAHENDACFDLYATAGGFLPQRGTGVFGAGVAFDIPAGYVMLIFGRSGLAFRDNLRLVNCTAVIDPGYHGEVMVGLYNDGNHTRTIERGDRIAQAMIIPRPRIALLEVDTFSTAKRESAGFGGSGR